MAALISRRFLAWHDSGYCAGAGHHWFGLMLATGLGLGLEDGDWLVSDSPDGLTLGLALRVELGLADDSILRVELGVDDG